MRPPLILLLVILILTAAHASPRSFSRRRNLRNNLRPSQVRKRFVLRLTPSGSFQVLRRRLRRLRFHNRRARCSIRRIYRKLRMLTVFCGIVKDTKTALLLNSQLKGLPGVKTSTPDAVLSAMPTETTRGDDQDDIPMFRTVRTVGEGLPYNWGLDRMDEDAAPLDGVEVDFSCYPSLGAGVKVFIIDTGCRTDHNEFTDTTVTTMPAPGSDFKSGNDDHGHGTHIAGVVVGKHVGLARKAEVVCIKSFDRYGNGAASDTISAVEYVMQQKYRNKNVPFIVNLSYSALTGFSETPLDEMVYAASAKGIIFVVSAGNAAVNSCLFSPSKAELAFTVTASTRADMLEEDSNIGPCVEFIAPGHNIVSAGIDSRRDYESLNGTSMATPHIVGLSALVMAEHPEMQADQRTLRDNLYDKLLTSRTATVDKFIMPLLETGCNALRSDEQETLPGTQAGNITATVPSAEPTPSPSPMPSPSSSPFPSPSCSPTLSPSPSLKPKYGAHDPEYWNHRHAWEMEEDLGGSNSDSAETYYQYGFGPVENPYKDSTL